MTDQTQSQHIKVFSLLPLTILISHFIKISYWSSLDDNFPEGNSRWWSIVIFSTAQRKWWSSLYALLMQPTDKKGSNFRFFLFCFCYRCLLDPLFCHGVHLRRAPPLHGVCYWPVYSVRACACFCQNLSAVQRWVAKDSLNSRSSVKNSRSIQNLQKHGLSVIWTNFT